MDTATISTRTGWFCLRTQPRREHTAAANLLERVGVDVFAPRIQTQKRARSGLVTALVEALFPGYLFARFEYPAQLRHVVSTAGVTGVVRFGAEPPVVPDEVIDFLRAQIGQAGTRIATPVLSEGSWVKIVAGCFRDVEGRILSFDPTTERVRVLLSLLGHEIQVSVFAHQVETSADKRPVFPRGLLASKTDAAPVAR